MLWGLPSRGFVAGLPRVPGNDAIDFAGAFLGYQAHTATRKGLDSDGDRTVLFAAVDVAGGPWVVGTDTIHHARFLFFGWAGHACQEMAGGAIVQGITRCVYDHCSFMQSFASGTTDTPVAPLILAIHTAIPFFLGRARGPSVQHWRGDQRISNLSPVPLAASLPRFPRIHTVDGARSLFGARATLPTMEGFHLHSDGSGLSAQRWTALAPWIELKFTIDVAGSGVWTWAGVSIVDGRHCNGWAAVLFTSCFVAGTPRWPRKCTGHVTIA